jgi:hypothetical protein
MLNKPHNNGDERLMTKFKVGDRVKIVAAKADFKEKYIGNEFVVAFVDGPYDKDLNSYYTLNEPATGGWRWADSELELAKQETPVTEFKAGDIIRVGSTHRNAFGSFINYPEVVNKEFTVKSVEDSYEGFQQVNLENSVYWVRSDDICLVSRKEDHPTVELTSEMIDWEDALFGNHETENIAAVYNITRVAEELVSLKIKKSFAWTSEDLIELGSHLFALAEYLETGTVDLLDEGECLWCENEHLRDSNERLASANDAKRQRLAKIRELTEV